MWRGCYMWRGCDRVWQGCGMRARCGVHATPCPRARSYTCHMDTCVTLTQAGGTVSHGHTVPVAWLLVASLPLARHSAERLRGERLRGEASRGGIPRRGQRWYRYHPSTVNRATVHVNGRPCCTLCPMSTLRELRSRMRGPSCQKKQKGYVGVCQHPQRGEGWETGFAGWR